MSRFVVVQIAPKKFVVAEAFTRGAVYRRICECNSEHGAKGVKDALVTAYDKTNGDVK